MTKIKSIKDRIESRISRVKSFIDQLLLRYQPSNNSVVIIGLILVFSGPLLHLVHYVVSDETIPGFFYVNWKNFVWLQLLHTEEAIILFGVGLIWSITKHKHWIIIFSPIIHCIVDFSMNILATSNEDIWLIHVITYGCLVCFQGMLFLNWNENYIWDDD